MESVQEYSRKFEDIIDKIGQPIKPYIPAIARFLIVVTFLEDALRISTQFSDQLFYLERHRGFPKGISHFFLLGNVIVSTALVWCPPLLAIWESSSRNINSFYQWVVFCCTVGNGLLLDNSIQDKVGQTNNHLKCATSDRIYAWCSTLCFFFHLDPWTTRLSQQGQALLFALVFLRYVFSLLLLCSPFFDPLDRERKNRLVLLTFGLSLPSPGFVLLASY